MVDDALPRSKTTALPDWQRRRRREGWRNFSLTLAVLVFIGFAIEYLDVRIERVLAMFGRLGDLFVNRYYPPDVAYVLERDYLAYVLETLQMSYLATLFGLVLSVPLAWFASFNMTPNRRILYPLARAVIIGCRSVHEMIWTILFVAVLGFGILPGVLALTLFCIGFAAKLFAEEVEAIDRGEVEAIRATGANPLQVFVFAVLPQVRVGWTGTAIYTWDVVFRAATVVGFFGAGGMGWYLRRTVQQLETHRVAAILLSIILLVVAAEIISALVRRWVSRIAA